MHFILSKLLIFLLLVFNKFLQPNRHLTLQLDLDVFDHSVGPS